MNNVTLIGRLTRDPETRYSQSAEPIAVTRISVAVNRKYKKDGEQEADFINCVSFGKTAEFISKYFIKGKMIGIVGSIVTNSWTDDKGQKRYSTEVKVDEVDFCGDKEDRTTNTQQDSDYCSTETDITEDMLPF